MTHARLIDGKAFATEVRARLAAEVATLARDHGLVPGLAVVLVGEDPASQVYVRSKGVQTREAGMASFEHRLPAETDAATLHALVTRLNNDPGVHGILVQLPLPAHLDAQQVIALIDPDKDVDGLHVVNAGRLAAGLPALVPCTPLGCMMLLEHELGADLSGKRALVLGRSSLVGRPVAQWLVHAKATVTIAHSRTRDLAEECRRADILVAAIGRPQMIPGDWIRPGAVVIDVGINRVDAGEGKTRLVGDVDFASAVKVAGAITPVPGGVGPMTIACLLQNTLTAARRQAGLA